MSSGMARRGSTATQRADQGGPRGLACGPSLQGACAIVAIATLLAQMRWLNVLRFCGEHSIVIYLAFFLPMAATRTLLLKTGVVHDIGMVSLLATILGVAGSILIWRAALTLGANFLFERPEAFQIAPQKATPALQAAE